MRIKHRATLGRWLTAADVSQIATLIVEADGNARVWLPQAVDLLERIEEQGPLPHIEVIMRYFHLLSCILGTTHRAVHPDVIRIRKRVLLNAKAYRERIHNFNQLPYRSLEDRAAIAGVLVYHETLIKGLY